MRARIKVLIAIFVSIGGLAVGVLTAQTPGVDADITASHVVCEPKLSFTGLVNGRLVGTRMIPVRGKLDWLDTSSATTLYWRLVVSRKGTGVVWQQTYENPPIVTTKGVRALPTFSQDLAMPAGSYYVTLEAVQRVIDGDTGGQEDYPRAFALAMATVNP
jgi:hypothetical protein